MGHVSPQAAHAEADAEEEGLTADTRQALAALQVGTLWVPAREGYDVESEESSPQAAALAREQGFEVLGRGSSRVAVDVDGDVAKVSHSLLGLALNLQEASCWLMLPEQFREHLTPCVTLTPELVLVQERVSVVGPPLVDDPPGFDWYQGQLEAAFTYAAQLYGCREALGLGSDPNPAMIRPDNFGLRDGRVVLIDYGEGEFPPLLPAWTWLLGRLEDDNPVVIEDERERFDANEIPLPDRPTARSLAERAGLNDENTEGCPCLCGGTFSEGGPDCGMDVDVADDLIEEMAQRKVAA